MLRAPITWLALVLISGGAPAKVAKVSSASAPAGTPPAQALSPNDSSPYDSDAERQLFDLANRARAQAGVPPLQLDEGLTQAARAHAAEMAAQQQLSHQLPGEPSLIQRLATNSTLHLDGAGENVAFSGNVNQAQDSLMQSPPHRANLLNSAYNVAGFGVVRSGYVLYVAQDFGHGLPTYSTPQAEQTVAESVAQVRREAHLRQLQRTDDPAAQAAACSMAQADSLHTSSPRGLYLLRYTTMQPETLPAGVAQAIGDRGLREFSVGTCYARTNAYPNGAYWVVLVLN